MKKFIPFLIAIVLISVTSCEESIDDKLLLGDWTAAAFLDNGQPKDVDLKAINFQFYNNHTYTYQGLMNKEAGNFYIKRNLLYTTDTLSTESVEKSVKIAKITSDSLFFEMNNRGITQIIKLYKNK